MSVSVTLDANTFSIKTAAFEGPMELLLELVEKRKLLINDISLAAVTDEYMQEVSLMQEMSLPNTAQFIQLAATLLLIKSKSLLPVLQLTEEEESSIIDLEERLKRYQVYRDASEHIEALFGQSVMHERQFVPTSLPLFTTDKYTDKDELAAAMHRVFSTLPLKAEKPRVQIRTIISLEEMIDRLHKRIESASRTTLRELLEHDQEPKLVIVGFLAILESVKQGSILVAQIERFADIEIEQDKLSAPRYF